MQSREPTRKKIKINFWILHKFVRPTKGSFLTVNHTYRADSLASSIETWALGFDRSISMTQIQHNTTHHPFKCVQASKRERERESAKRFDELEFTFTRIEGIVMPPLPWLKYQNVPFPGSLSWFSSFQWLSLKNCHSGLCYSKAPTAVKEDSSRILYFINYYDGDLI